MNEIKVIPSKFNNVVFRSRLEARWAVFFTELGINWEYEYEGYELNGTWYLPDFYLPEWNGGTYIEVKPKGFSEDEYRKVMDLCIATKHPVFKAVGSPEPIFYEILFPMIHRGIDNFCLYYTNFSLHWKADKEKRFWTEPTNHEYKIEKRFDEKLFNAIQVSKSYRF